MLKKYNIALIPIKNSRQFVNYAIALSRNILSATYLLGEKSLPHVSLCHFETDENNIETIW